MAASCTSRAATGPLRARTGNGHDHHTRRGIRLWTCSLRPGREISPAKLARVPTATVRTIPLFRRAGTWRVIAFAQSREPAAAGPDDRIRSPHRGTRVIALATMGSPCATRGRLVPSRERGRRDAESRHRSYGHGVAGPRWPRSSHPCRSEDPSLPRGPGAREDLREDRSLNDALRQRTRTGDARR